MATDTAVPPATMLALPREVQIEFIRLLDPVALISLSQANKHFRAVISPGRVELAERLLVLECTIEHGGGTPNIQRGKPDPSPADDDGHAWDALRWACTSCLRLLPQTHFDNGSLLRRGLRKPIAGSPAADLITSWEPTLHHKKWGRKFPRPPHAVKDDMDKTYHIANVFSWRQSPRTSQAYADLTWAQEHGLQGFDGMSLGQVYHKPPLEKKALFDQHLLNIDLQRCGYERFRRKCNECRFKIGDLGRGVGGVAGTPEVPIQNSRLLLFPTSFDRYFPGLWRRLAAQRPSHDALVWRVFRSEATSVYYQLRMMRCSGCEQWQEMRCFRMGDNDHWKPIFQPGGPHATRNWDGEMVNAEYINHVRCNACYAQEFGKQKLGQKLASFSSWLLLAKVDNLEGWLEFGFDLLKRRPDVVAKKLRPQVMALGRQAPFSRIKIHSPFSDDEDSDEQDSDEQDSDEEGSDGTDTDELGRRELSPNQRVDILRAYHTRLGEILEEGAKDNNGEGWQTLVTSDWLVRIQTHFESFYAHRRWLLQADQELRRNPNILVEWALNRKGDSLM